jgi:MFS transporter, ACS family, glucarate transporter
MKQTHPPFPIRHRVLALIAIASGITYLDRVCISVATPAMMGELGLSNMQMGYVFGVFALSYGMFEIPVGWLSDKIGQRKMLTRIVACWSIFTAATGMIWGYFSLLSIRFLFGAAEAGAFPSMARALARWFRTTDRGRANGIMWMGARLGGAAAPPLATLMIAWLGWRLPFTIFGLVGGIWCIFFWWLYRDKPAEHPAISAAELSYLSHESSPRPAGNRGPISWTRLFTSSNMWAFFGMYFATSYGFWFLLTWLPTYLIRQYGVSLEMSGFYSGLPLAVGAISCVTGGATSDWLVRHTGSLRWGRRLVGLAGYLICGVGFAAAGLVHTAFLAILCLMMAEVGLDLATPVAWAACLEAGAEFGGTTTAFMNSASSISAFISPLAAAWMYTKFGTFNAMLMSAGAVYLLASLLWLKIDTTCLLGSAAT